MHALTVLRDKTFTPEKMSELDWFIWNNRLEDLSDKAAQELAALRSQLATVTAERDVMLEALKDAVKKLETEYAKTAASWAIPDVAEKHAAALVSVYTPALKGGKG